MSIADDVLVVLLIINIILLIINISVMWQIVQHKD